MNKKANIILHAVGGAGINIASAIVEKYDFDNLANLEIYSLDSTDKTVQAYPDLEETFYLIRSEKRRNRGLDGSGGERKNPALVKEYAANVKNYLDEFGLAEPKVENFHIVIHSGSGGTGSTAGALLIQELIQAGNVVIPVTVVDNSSLLFTNNSIKTIESLENIANKNKIAMPLIVYNNTIDGVTNRGTEKQINEKVVTLMYLLGTALSGKIRNIDNEDMRKFLQPSLFKSIRVNNGVYELAVKIGELDIEDAFLVRTLTTENEEDDVVITSPVLQAKTGFIIDNELEGLFDKLPIHLFLRNDSIFQLFENLEKVYEELEQKTKQKRKTLRSSRNSEEDDTGLVL